MKLTKVLLLVVITTLSVIVNAQTFHFDFQDGYQDWTGDFADYPVGDSIMYDLRFERTNLPEPLDPDEYSLMMTGVNHSDDLFMFIKRKITGLMPNTSYELFIDVEFASNVPTNHYGVGGPPAEAVMMKAGATLIEPQKVDVDGYYLMNIDKNNQISPGPDMDTIGHIGVTDTTTVYTLINRNNSARLFNITTDSNGEVWVCIGTDSGFEYRSTVYYNKIKLDFKIITSNQSRNIAPEVSVYPNPAGDFIVISSDNCLAGTSFEITDISGRLVKKGILNINNHRINVENLSQGLYYIKLNDSFIKGSRFIKY